MSTYPVTVSQIVYDYMDRLKSELRSVSAQQRDEFLKEIESHVYESYQLAAEENEVARILAVLRRLGAPAEVVSGQLASAFVKAGTERNLPLYLVSGIIVALFGIPLGFGGIAVLMGVLLTVVGFVITYYAVVGVALLSAALFLSIGLVRVYLPEFWDRLVSFGVIQMNGRLADFLEPLSAAQQGLLFILMGAVFAGAGLGMLHLGRHLVRGLRFLCRLALESLLHLGQNLRRKWRTYSNAGQTRLSPQSQTTP